jgi:hypothetical protein
MVLQSLRGYWDFSANALPLAILLAEGSSFNTILAGSPRPADTDPRTLSAAVVFAAVLHRYPG